MKRIIQYFALLIICGCIFFPFILVVSIVDTQPRVNQGPKLSFDNIKRVKRLIQKHKPRHMRFRQTRTIRILENDLNLVLNYGVTQGLKKGENIYPEISLSPSGIRLDATIKIPRTPLGEYINLALGLTSSGKSLDIDYFQAGGLRIPGKIIIPVLPIIGNHFLSAPILNQLEDSLNAVHSVSIIHKTLILVYHWNPQNLLKLHESGKALLIPLDHQRRIIGYTNETTRILKELPPSRSVSLARVIRPLFQFAQTQSKISRDPALENTALLQALSLYALGRNLDAIVNTNELNRVEPRQKKRFTLFGRKDLATHFLVSAGLGVSAGTRLSRFAGLAKEVADADRGSGFSFADLAADRAGIKLGELALASKTQAARLQRQMASVTGETDFMPGIARLPEGIMALEFKEKYQDLDSKSYAIVDEEINRRLKKCRVYQRIEDSEG